MWHMFEKTVVENPLVTAFAFVGLIVWLSNVLARHLTGGRVAGSAIGDTLCGNVAQRSGPIPKFELERRIAVLRQEIGTSLPFTSGVALASSNLDIDDIDRLEWQQLSRQHHTEAGLGFVRRVD